jgi:hypothetical protein
MEFMGPIFVWLMGLIAGAVGWALAAPIFKERNRAGRLLERGLTRRRQYAALHRLLVVMDQEHK